MIAAFEPADPGDRHVLRDELVQAGLFTQPHHRGQAAERDQIRVIENRFNNVADSHYECSCQAADVNLSSPILACHRSIRHQTRPTGPAHSG